MPSASTKRSSPPPPTRRADTVGATVVAASAPSPPTPAAPAGPLDAGDAAGDAGGAAGGQVDGHRRRVAAVIEGVTAGAAVNGPRQGSAVAEGEGVVPAAACDQVKLRRSADGERVGAA